MDRSLSPGDRKVKASAGKCTQVGQRELALLHEAQGIEPMALLPETALYGATFSGVLRHALLSSGLEQNDLLDEMHISEGYLSRFMSSLAEAWAKRVLRFMKATSRVWPLQWMADQMGCDLVLRDSRAAEVAALRARLNELEGRAAA